MKLYVILAIAALVPLLAYLSSCQSDVSIQTAQYAANGQKLYKTHCENCHGGKGEGLGTLYPPLTDGRFLAEHRDRLPCIVRHGLDGKIVVSGQEYDQPMPGNAVLTDLDIAYILTYVTTTFGGADSAFTHDEVRQALEQCDR